MNRRGLAEMLREVGGRLRADGGDATRDLRGLQERLADGAGDEAELRFLSFFLGLFIEDVFYNLTGDFRYTHRDGEQTYQLRSEAFTKIGDALVSLSEAVDGGAMTSSYEACITLSAGYLDTIDRIVDLTSSH